MASVEEPSVGNRDRASARDIVDDAAPALSGPSEAARPAVTCPIAQRAAEKSRGAGPEARASCGGRRAAAAARARYEWRADLGGLAASMIRRIQQAKLRRNAYNERDNRTALHEWPDRHIFGVIVEARDFTIRWL
jgi:hypothetical protein